MKKNVVLRMLLLAASLVLVLAACQQPGTGADPITGLAVTPAEVTLDVGATQQLAAVLEYESGKTVEADVSWKSSDSGVATVAEDGLVTAVAEGTATVTATSTANATHTASSSITVTAEEEPGDGRVVLSSGSMNLVRTQTFDIEADVEVEGDATGRVTWYSSAPSVVEVSPTGDARAMLKAVGVGSSTITATSTADSDAYASITVTVTALTVSIDLVWTEHAVGREGTLTGIIGGSFTGADSGLTWEVIDDDGAIDIDDGASVSGQAKAFTSTDSGSVTIRATSVQDDAVFDSVVVDLLGPGVVDSANLYVGDWTSPGDGAYGRGTVFNPYPFDDIGTAITELDEDGTIWVASGTYFRNSSLAISKPLTLRGAGESETTIDLSGHGSYGINVTASSVVIQDLTVIGPSTGGTPSQQFGVRVYDVDNFRMSDVTIQASGWSELDLNAVNGATLTGVTLDGADSEGVGLALTDTTDVAAEGLETMGNNWGGVGIWPTVGGTVSGVSIDAFSNLAEEVPVYVQIKDGLDSVEQLELEGYEFAVRNPDYRPADGVFTFYFNDLTRAGSWASSLNGPDAFQSTIQRVSADDAANLIPGVYLAPVSLGLEEAIAPVADGSTVEIHGEHTSTKNTGIKIDKKLTIDGVDGAALLIVADNAKGFVLQSGAAETPAGTTIKGLRIRLDEGARYGVELKGGARTTYLSINDITLQGLQIFGADASAPSGTAIKVESGTRTTGFTMSNVSIANVSSGLWVAVDNRPYTVFDDVELTNVTIENAANKGLYFEALSNAVFSGLEISNSGNVGNSTNENGAGISLSIWNNTATGIKIVDSVITNSGASTGGGGAALTLKAASSPTHTATLSGITLTNTVLSNTSVAPGSSGVALQVGDDPDTRDPDRIYYGPANVTMSGGSLEGAKSALVNHTGNPVELTNVEIIGGIVGQ